MIRMAVIAPQAVSDMRARLRAQTDEAIFDAFGISMRTWIKVREGHAVRLSTATRLLHRVYSGAGPDAVARLLVDAA
jgi:hypothetical protein